ncbi:MAG: outer membrane protein assembly factor BamD [Methylobacteriaceae bacterium]|nr:outer membrane protein assembly factor BamD [Methylobacteriaceae bacterium]
MTFASFAAVSSGSRLHGTAALVGRIAAALILFAPIAACSTLGSLNPFGPEKYETKILPNNPPETLYDQGLARLRNRDGEGAAKKFSAIEKQFPSTDWSKKGLLMSTYANYMGGKYDDAIESGKRYVSLYPADSDAAYALYLVGMANYDQIPDVSRDQERTEKALEAFTDLVNKYPKSEYADDAKFKIQVTRDQLAGKEMSIGRHYLARQNYVGAINRFREVLAKYQNTRHTEEALERLTEAYMALGITNEAQTAAAILGHNFPDSQWYKDAYDLLKTGGLEPREDEGSWISKAFKRIGLS